MSTTLQVTTYDVLRAAATDIDSDNVKLKVDVVSTVTAAQTSITANAGTNLNTSLLALESGGNLAAIAAKDFATQTTLALIKAKTDNIDVALSTRTKPADTQTISGAVTATLNAETTKVIGVTRTADGAGNLVTSHTAGSSKGLDVAILDGSGNQITSFGGGTQYADGGAAATPTGNQINWNSSGTQASVSTSKPLPVQLRNSGGTAIGDATTPVQVSLANTAANSTAVKVDGSAVTQPVSGTVTASNTTGNIAHDSVDSGNPVKVGARAVAHGATPTEVAAADRTDLLSNRMGVPFFMGGVPNVITIRLAISGANTNVNVIDVSSGSKCVVTAWHVSLAYNNLAFPAIRVGFGTATVPTTTGAFIGIAGAAPGSFFQAGNGGGIIAVGADAEDVRITNEDPNGTAELVISYYLVAS